MPNGLLRLRHERPRLTFFSRLPCNAALWSVPPPREEGSEALPTYGKERLDLAQRAGQPHGWQESDVCAVWPDGDQADQDVPATWRPAGGMIRVVIVREPDGWRAYFSTDPARTGRDSGAGSGSRGSGGDVQDLKEVWGGQQQVRNLWANVGAFNLNGWMYSAVERGPGSVRTRSWWIAAPVRGQRSGGLAQRTSGKRCNVRSLRAETLQALRDGPDSEGFQQLLDRC